MKCTIQLGFASLNGTFHLSPHENICTIALINIHYLYTNPGYLIIIPFSKFDANIKGAAHPEKPCIKVNNCADYAIIDPVQQGFPTCGRMWPARQFCGARKVKCFHVFAELMK